MLKGSPGARLPATGPRHLSRRALPGHQPSPPPLTGERLGPPATAYTSEFPSVDMPWL